MELSFYDSLSRKKVVFSPLNKDKVSLYVCGPTVYSYPHIGNARSAVIYDLLYRLLKLLYKDITYVRNITDVDDKIIAASQKEKKSIAEITEYYTNKFHLDMEYLNCLVPTYEPKVTEHMDDIINMIKALLDNESAYLSKGHIYFDIHKYDKYGILSGKKIEDLIDGVRINVSDNKKHAGDFVLWKPALIDEQGWDSPWGRGRPGWHIECSAMSKRYLGSNFDIHGGGADLKFPHHENEIAQSCCAEKGSNFAKYWMHNGFLTVDGEKMSKSLGNFITVNDLRISDISGASVRYALLSTHYAKPLNWNRQVLDNATHAINTLKKSIFSNDDMLSHYKNRQEHESIIHNSIIQYLCNDLNTHSTLQELYKLSQQILHEGKTDIDAQNRYNTMIDIAMFLGLIVEEDLKKVDIDKSLQEKIEKLLSQRKEAKNNKDFELADNIRNTLQDMGIQIKDTSDGNTIWECK